MKISAIDVIHIRPRFSLVKISTDEGIVGFGEAVVEGRSRTVETAVRELTPELIGQDPRRIEHLWQQMYRGTFYRGGPILTSAISGLEQAMWDILGKSLGAPVHQLLGGRVRDRIRMYKHVGGETIEQLHQSAAVAAKEGFTMVKTVIEIGRILETPSYLFRQIERIAAVREAIGNEVDLAVDFHGRISPALAIQLCKGFEPYNLLFVEEPCLPENVDTLVTIARSTSIPIATGERLFTKWAFREVLEKQAAAVLQPDLAHCGGILEGKKIAAMAETYYAAFAPHNPLGPINLAASLQLAANVPNFLAQEQVALGEGILKKPFVIVDGYIDVPNGPGLGIEVDEEAIKELQYAGDFQVPRAVHPQDQSVADW